ASSESSCLRSIRRRKTDYLVIYSKLVNVTEKEMSFVLITPAGPLCEEIPKWGLLYWIFQISGSFLKIENS
ncbi:MAG: hypothetical protein ACYS6I_06930, partial [Planctomycetota bacterium]